MKTKIIALISSFTITAGIFSGLQTISSAETGHAVNVSNGIITSAAAANAGETVTLTLPDDYVSNSLVISYKDAENKTDIPQNINISDKQCTFTMPDAAITASCLENNDSSKIVIVGTTSSFYARNDNDLNVTFKVPDLGTGYSYLTEVTVPARANVWNAKNMSAIMNGESYTVANGNISGVGNTITSNTDNVMTIKNENTAGVDYYYNQKGFYPVTAANLAVLTITKVKMWSGYRENTFTGEAIDYSIVWKVTSNPNDRKGASHTVDTENNIVTITSGSGADAGNTLYGISASIKNIQPNTKYTLTFKEKTNMTDFLNNGLYLNAVTLATNTTNTDPDATKDVTSLKSGKIATFHNALTNDTDWCERTVTYVSGEGLPEGYDTLQAKFTFMFRGITGTAQIKDLKISGAAAPEPTPTPSPVPAPIKKTDTDYTPPVHTGTAIDRLNTDDTFQYHFTGGTNDFMQTGTDTRTQDNGRKYDAYMWVPKTTSPDTLRGLIAIKLNLIEVPFAYSKVLREALAEKNFGILFIVDKNDNIPPDYTGEGKNYKNILQGMYTSTDYKGDSLFTADKFKTYDGKDAAQIMNELLAGIAAVSGYTCVAENTPLITIGHSAASPFGYRSGNWAYDRIIAQIHMKNGMWGDCTHSSNAENDAHGYGMVPNIPSLQYAAQYTEHSTGAGRDRSVCDARYHIDHQRAIDTNQLVSHIIEWGSGHYDWSNNASEILTKYIVKAIDYRLPDTFKGGNDKYILNNLTESGYLMKPFEKDENGSERAAGYYRDTLRGWLSDGKNNAEAVEADKKASFWFFDKELADEINAFTNYAIPESPSVNDTKVSGKTHSDYEPYMLMKNPSNSVYANTKYDFNSYISPFDKFNGNMSRYGNHRFINYEKMETPANGNGDSNPTLGATNTANLKGYDTFTADTYYMNKIPSVITSNGEAYDGTGGKAAVPEDTKAELIPLMAPYELIKSEIIDISAMTKDGTVLADNVASVTRNTMRFHNNRVYYNTGCQYTSGTGKAQESFSMIYSPEIKNTDGSIKSIFKVTATGMTIPYVSKGTRQELTLNTINDVTADSSPIDVIYTSNDSDLQKYTDVYVDYGPAKAVRTVNPSDGSYSWKIEILKDEIPSSANYPIEVKIVASNLGKWESVSGASDETTFNIISNNVMPTATPTLTPTPTPTPTPTLTPMPTTTLTPSDKTVITAAIINNIECSNSLPTSGVLTAVKVRRANNDSLNNCHIYAALYKDNKLTNIIRTEITDFSDNDKTIALSSSINIDNAQELKVFVWDNKMTPAADILYIKN